VNVHTWMKNQNGCAWLRFTRSVLAFIHASIWVYHRPLLEPKNCLTSYATIYSAVIDHLTPSPTKLYP